MKTNLRVNMNGDTLDILMDQFNEIMEASVRLKNAIIAAHPHGRNYPHDHDKLYVDIVTMEGMRAQVEEIYNYAINSMENLIDGC